MLTGDNRVLVIGLDGMGTDALAHIFARGAMPRLAALAARGVRGTLKSTVPPCTCPAWPTMCTGVGPGRHGVFSFVFRGETVKKGPGPFSGGTGGVRLSSATDLAAPRFWQLAARAGRRAAVLFVPTMFPADAVEPLAVSGYPAPDRAGASAVYPPAAEEALRQAIPEFQASPALPFAARPGESRHEAHARAIRDAAAADAHRVTTAFDHALAGGRQSAEVTHGRDEGGAIDLAMVVFSFPDHLFHSHYACVLAPDDAPGPVLAMRRVADEALGRIDDALGRIIERFGDPATVLVVSDHGFAAKRGSVHVAECLAQAGLLAPAGIGFLLKRLFRRRRTADAGLVLVADDPWTDPGLDWNRTRAFPGYDHEQGVFVNLRGRNPRGIVGPKEYGAVIESARQALLAVRDPATGDRPVRAARRRDEIYSGPYVDRAPDILVELADGWQVRRKLSWRMRGRPPVSRHAGLGGVHHPDGILLAAGPAVKAGAAGTEAQMADIAATVLALAGLAPAGPLDGRPLDEVFMLPAARQTVRLDGPVPGAASGFAKATPDRSGYSEADENEVARRLEDLGYL